MVYADTVEHRREFSAVLGIVDILCRCAKYGYIHSIELHGAVVRNLSAGSNDDTMRHLQVNDVHNAFKGQLIKVETVTHIIVGRHCLGVEVDHDRAVALLTYSVQRLNATPVELYRRTDTVGTRTEHDDRALIVFIMYIVVRAGISDIEIVCLCRIFCSKGINLFHHRYDT